MKLRTLFIIFPLIACSGCSDSNIEYTKQYVNIAKNIAPKIPEGSKVALKMTSPDKNGLPEAFLQKLMAEFSGALVQSSNDKFVVLNRNSTEEIWQDAVEFNNQDIDSITSSAEADISISLSPKINESGIDLSVTVYSLMQGTTGNILASVTQLVPMNVKAELGVDVKSIDKKLDQISELVNKDDAKKNELIDIFLKFADQPDLNGMARVFSKGCDKPISLREKWETHFNSSEFKKHCALISDSSGNCKEPYGSEFFANFKDGFEIKCEVYDEGRTIVVENIMFDKTLHMQIELGGLKGQVESLNLSGPVINDQIEIPKKLQKYAKLVMCDDTGSRHNGTSIFRVSIPNSTPFYVARTSSSGASITSQSLRLFYKLDYLTNSTDPDIRYINYGEKFSTIDPSEPPYDRCNDQSYGGFLES